MTTPGVDSTWFNHPGANLTWVTCANPPHLEGSHHTFSILSMSQIMSNVTTTTKHHKTEGFTRQVRRQLGFHLCMGHDKMTQNHLVDDMLDVTQEVWMQRHGPNGYAGHESSQGWALHICEWILPFAVCFERRCLSISLWHMNLRFCAWSPLRSWPQPPKVTNSSAMVGWMATEAWAFRGQYGNPHGRSPTQWIIT